MNWQNNEHIVASLALVHSFLDAERGKVVEARRTGCLRRLVELSSEPDVLRRRCISAAFGLVAAGLEPSADDIAWLVRDRDIGFPQHPSFDF